MNILTEQDINRFNALKVFNKVLSNNEIFDIADNKTKGTPATETEVYLMHQLGWNLEKVREVVQDALIMGLIKEAKK